MLHNGRNHIVVLLTRRHLKSALKKMLKKKNTCDFTIHKTPESEKKILEIMYSDHKKISKSSIFYDLARFDITKNDVCEQNRALLLLQVLKTNRLIV